MPAVSSQIIEASRYKDYNVVSFKITVDGAAVKETTPEGLSPDDKVFRIQVQDGINVQDELLKFVQKYKAGLEPVATTTVTDVTV
jgi:predicted Rdx family selenoprotein